MKNQLIPSKFIALGTALLLGLLLVSSLLVGMALAQEPQPGQVDMAAVEGVSYWLILDTARPVEETLPPLLETLAALKASGAIVEFDSNPQRSAPTAATGVRVIVAGSERLDLLRTLPGVLDAVVTLPPPPPQLGDLGTLATTGEITGLVTDTVDGSLLNNITVYAYDAVSFAYIDFDLTGLMGDPPGEYTLYGTAAYSQAKVVFSRQQGNNAYLQEWYNDKPFFSEATPIDLPDGGVVTNINAALRRAGTISGTVTDQGGGPATGVKIAIYGSDGYPINLPINWPTVNASGLFISYVPSGTYKLKLSRDDYGDYLDEWYQDKDSEENATPIVVTNGATTTLTAQVTRTGAISGVITELGTGYELSNIQVTAYDAAGKEVGSAFSSYVDGKYRLTGLLAGNYRLRFHTDSLNFDTEYYNNRSTLAAADTVTVALGATTGNINAALTPATGQITGTITKNGGAPLAAGEFAYVNLFDFATDDQMGYINFFGDGTTTIYTYTVATGTYKVEFFPYFDAFSQWYNNQTDQANANPVVIVNGATTPNINADLTVMTSTVTSGCITGTVTTGGSAPLEHADVRVYEVGDDWWQSSGTTGPAGDYSICHLEAGNYQVSFSYYPSATTWYNGQTSRTAATTVTVTTGVTTTDVNGSLDQLGGCIKGKVTDLNGKAMPSAIFRIFEAGGKAIPIYFGNYNTHLSNQGEADEDGGFVACGLQPGDYTVVARWYGSGSEQNGSVTAHVIAGQQTDVGAVKVSLHLYLPIIVKN